MTDAAERWQGEFGREYTRRNSGSKDALDALYVDRFGVSRADLNHEFLGPLALRSVLEVGCNVGMQLRHLGPLTGARMSGVDLQQGALDEARAHLPGADLRVARATDLPFPDASFDLVFTSGVLIHVPPSDLDRVMDEIHRVSSRWIWGFEYWAAMPTEVAYRGHSGLLWKRDFRAAWQERFPTLRLVRERRLAHEDSPGLCDVMYLLEKA